MRLYVSLFVALIAISAAPSTACAGDNEKVDKFLTRLGLIDLQIVHLEQTLAGQTDTTEQTKLAKRLADLYAGRLMEVADNPQRYDELLAGIQRLTTNHPQARTSALEVMLLQADYNRAESQVGKWLADDKNTSARDEATQILNKITPQLKTYQGDLNKSVAVLLKDLEDLPDGDEREEKEQQLAREQALAGRATYFAGWSSYYHGLLTSGAAAKNKFSLARDMFQKLLALDEEDADYGEVEVEWLGLESIWRARSVIGLGLAEAALGNIKQSGIVFAWLESSSAAPQIRDQAAYWYVQGLLNAGELATAQAYAAQRIDKFTGDASQGKVSLCVTLVRAGFGAGDAAAKPLGQLGVKGLVKLRQFALLKKLMAKYSIDLATGGGFYLTWLAGQQKFDAAERTKNKADYSAAADLFTKALADEEADRDITSSAHCRYNRGWCRYRLGKYRDAAADFEQAVTGLKNADPETAVQSAWLAFAAYRQLVADNPAAASSAVDVLERIKRDFPSSKFAQQADYQIAKLRNAAATPAESIASLRKIKPGAENYLAARYDLCQLLHQQLKSQSNPASARAQLGELEQAVDVYQKAAAGKEPARVLTVLTKLVDAALHLQPPELPTATAALKDAGGLAARLPDEEPSLAEFHYHALQLAKLNKDDDARREHAGWIVKHAAGSRYELPALVTVAMALESQIKEADARSATALKSEALDVYARLSGALGDAPEILKRHKNARIALSKQADYAQQLGRHEVADAAMEKLLAVFPKDRKYLRRAALASFHAGRYERSLGNWETLLRGLTAGEDEWMEAKYHQIAALAKRDKSTASRVYKQFVLLYPEMGGDRWRAKFESLGKRLAQG